MYLVLDQAEEYFLYHADDGGPGSFAEALPLVLGCAVSRQRARLAARGLAREARPLHRTRSRASSRTRSASTASTAPPHGRPSLRPVERYAELTRRGGRPSSRSSSSAYSTRSAPARSSLHSAGLGGVEGGDVGGRIEAPYLQLVMQRLWEEERAAGSSELRVETLDRLGGAQHIVEEHLEGAMADSDAGAEGYRGQALQPPRHAVGDEDRARRRRSRRLRPGLRIRVWPVLDCRCQSAASCARSTRAVPFGTRSSTTSSASLCSRGEPSTKRPRDLEAQKRASDRRHRQLLAVIGVGAVLLAVMGAVTVYAVTQRTEAREQARNAKANELDANADALLASDPEFSVLLASRGRATRPGESAERALRRSLLDSRVRAVAERRRGSAGRAFAGRPARRSDRGRRARPCQSDNGRGGEPRRDRSRRRTTRPSQTTGLLSSPAATVG